MSDAKTVKFLLRLDETTHRALVAEAKRAERSVNSELLVRLRLTLQAAKVGVSRSITNRSSPCPESRA
jgi:predicted HicB family RNase H-like nuclease